MNALLKLFTSQIGRKALAGITGLGLVGFLVAHLSGNLLLYSGAEAFNGYAEWLHSLPGFALLEIGLLGMFVVHIWAVLSLAKENKAARGSSYVVEGTKQTNFLAQAASKMMVMSGIVVLTFLVVHILDYRLQHPDNGDVYGLVYDSFASIWRVLLYVSASLFIGWHVFHGIQSATRSLGLHHPAYTPLITKAGAALAVLLAIGFASLPLLLVH